MAAIVNGQEVLLSGTVGAEWFEDGFSHTDVVIALAGLEDDITVRLNTGGGYASEGAAIHAALSNYPGKVAIVVEGIAASAGSLIAMAGDSITMTLGSIMMIHDPANISMGTSDDHAKNIEYLEAMATAYSRVYAARSGKTEAECREIMKATTWFEGAQAVEAGFATEAVSGKGKAQAVAAYDYRDYDHTPKRLAALAKAKNWSISDYRPIPTEPAKADTKQDENMTDKERADALALELATANAAKEKAEADLTALRAVATTEQATAADTAVKADRDRRAAIMALPETAGREALAEVLFADGATAEKAKAYLGAVPVATVAEVDPAAAYEAARLSGAVVVGGDKAAADGGWKKAVANYNKHTSK